VCTMLLLQHASSKRDTGGTEAGSLHRINPVGATAAAAAAPRTSLRSCSRAAAAAILSATSLARSENARAVTDRTCTAESSPCCCCCC